MGISVKLEQFEGPLDLLLHLIDKNKVDIFDIPIVEITNQYMDLNSLRNIIRDFTSSISVQRRSVSRFRNRKKDVTIFYWHIIRCILKVMHCGEQI